MNTLQTVRTLREEFVGHGSSVTCLSLGQKSGRVMATGGEDRKLNLWAVGNPGAIMSIPAFTTSIVCVKFNHNEDLISAGSVTGALKVWDLEAPKLLRTLTGHKCTIQCTDFHPYGDFLASGSSDTNIKLWDVRKKGCMYTYKGHTKGVCCLKFSPDGRWLASGGEEGSVKLWDLPAGKLLAEFKEHSAAVTDVCFHPNEFLLSSGSKDGTVKFWDLETFKQVSMTPNDAGPVRKILYHPEGKALFSGAKDVLKVYGWEPARTLDTVIMNWGKVCDMAVSDNQLVAGTFSLTNVSVFVVDLSKVQPFAPPTQNKSIYVRDSFSRQSTRRNFIRGSCSTSHSQLESLESNKSEDTTTSDETWDDLSITEVKDFKEIFSPRSELSRTPPKDTPLSPSSLSTDNSHPLSDPYLKASLASLSSYSSTATAGNRCLSGMHSATSLSSIVPKPLTAVGTNASSTSSLAVSQSKVYTAAQGGPSFPAISHYTDLGSIRQPVATKSTTFSNGNTAVTVKISNSVVPTSTDTVQNKRPTGFVQSRQSEMISIVRPVINDSKTIKPLNGQISNLPETAPPAAVVFPAPKTDSRLKLPDSPTELIPEARDHPAGLDVDEFLPKHLQATVKLGYNPQPEISESEAMQTIFRGHNSVIAALSHRKKNLQIVLALWSTKDSRSALEQALQMEDQSVIVDVLNIITLKPATWTLDMCQLLLPVTYDLLRSKYESYMSVGCAALKIVLKNFGTMIKTNITAPPGIGVDISREERYNKCMSCYNQLLSVRAFILKRQTLQGKLGRTFRELSILMQNLE